MTRSIVSSLLTGLPPIAQVAVTAMLPREAKDQLDAVLADLAGDLANRRDIQACTKLRKLFAEIGVDLAPYVEFSNQPE